MLVRRDALERAGGIASIRAEIIDDCALARRLKAEGPIWLGLTRRARSLRPYGGFREIGRMVSRSAYAQLGYSPLLLAGTVAGMVLTFLMAPIVDAFRQRACAGGGAVRLAADGVRLPAHAPLLPPLAAVGRWPCRRSRRPIRCSPCSRPWKSGAAAAACGRGAPGHGGRPMTGAADFASGKGHRDENFPVASRLIRPELRPAILAFYRFARAADDVADHAHAAPEEKLEQLARMEAGLRGEAGASPEADCAACHPAGAWPLRSPCARSAGSLPARRHQAALRRLGGAHGLLPLFRGPGRSLRARRAWRGARRSGRPTTRSAPRCR